MTTAQTTSWIAVARSRALRRKPLRVVVAGTPYVLFRSEGAIHCLFDICPHRSAPLSGGRVIGDTIECPYHGWRFAGSGLCTAMPALLGRLPRIMTTSFPALEKDGLIFIARQPQQAQPYTTVLADGDTVSAIVESRVTSTLAEVAENILDATHTHFTHKGILRGLTSRRYRVTITVTGGDGFVEARYEGEPRQEGIVSRLLEGERTVGVGRFLFPGIAELEFWGPRGINLATTFHLRQETDDTVAGFGILSGPRQHGIGHLKALLFKPFFRIALGQDRHILEAAEHNRRRFADRKQVIGPLDVMRPHIDAILAGRRPSVADTPIVMQMEL